MQLTISQNLRSRCSWGVGSSFTRVFVFIAVKQKGYHSKKSLYVLNLCQWLILLFKNDKNVLVNLLKYT